MEVFKVTDVDYAMKYWNEPQNTLVILTHPVEWVLFFFLADYFLLGYHCILNGGVFKQKPYCPKHISLTSAVFPGYRIDTLTE